jgi:hypothetical protein
LDFERMIDLLAPPAKKLAGNFLRGDGYPVLSELYLGLLVLGLVFTLSVAGVGYSDIRYKMLPLRYGKER